MDDLFLNTYQDKNVLVTGHTGFVGGWLSLWLNKLGANVIGYSLEPSTEPNFFNSVNLGCSIESHNIGDVRNSKRLMAAFQKHQPEIVFHLAAQPLVRLSYEEPKLTYETNIIGTVNVLEAIRGTRSVKTCVVVTSDKCYENKEWQFGYREIDPMGGYDPYSSSKGCAELVTAAYRKSFFNPKECKNHSIALSSVRSGNIIGGGDWGQDRLIPDSVKALSQKKKICIRNPKATRPWQFVLEPLAGYLWLGALMYQQGSEYADSWNLGPNDNTLLTVEELVCLFMKEWGSGGYKIRKINKLHETNLLRLDTSKASSVLKWSPVYSIFEAVRETAAWYRKFYFEGRKGLLNFTISQIERYIEQAKKNNLLWSAEF